MSDNEEAVTRSKRIVNATEWEGDLRANITTVLGAGRVLAKRVAELEADLPSAMMHLLAIEDVIPGKWLSDCRCDKCRLVAKAMDDAGHLDEVQDRWWE